MGLQRVRQDLAAKQQQPYDRPIVLFCEEAVFVLCAVLGCFVLYKPIFKVWYQTEPGGF